MVTDFRNSKKTSLHATRFAFEMVKGKRRKKKRKKETKREKSIEGGVGSSSWERRDPTVLP